MPLPPEEIARLFAIGPAAARLEVATTDIHGSTPQSLRKKLVLDWADAEDSRLAEEAEARREAREERTLAITVSALEIAKESASSAHRAASFAEAQATSAERQAKWARWAAIIAAIAAISATSVQINELISWIQR